MEEHDQGLGPQKYGFNSIYLYLNSVLNPNSPIENAVTHYVKEKEQYAQRHSLQVIPFSIREMTEVLKDNDGIKGFLDATCDRDGIPNPGYIVMAFTNMINHGRYQESGGEVSSFDVWDAKHVGQYLTLRQWKDALVDLSIEINDENPTQAQSKRVAFSAKIARFFSRYAIEQLAPMYGENQILALVDSIRELPQTAHQTEIAKTKILQGLRNLLHEKDMGDVLECYDNSKPSKTGRRLLKYEDIIDQAIHMASSNPKLDSKQREQLFNLRSIFSERAYDMSGIPMG